MPDPASLVTAVTACVRTFIASLDLPVDPICLASPIQLVTSTSAPDVSAVLQLRVDMPPGRLPGARSGRFPELRQIP